MDRKKEESPPRVKLARHLKKTFKFLRTAKQLHFPRGKSWLSHCALLLLKMMMILFSLWLLRTRWDRTNHITIVQLALRKTPLPPNILMFWTGSTLIVAFLSNAQLSFIRPGYCSQWSSGPIKLLDPMKAVNDDKRWFWMNVDRAPNEKPSFARAMYIAIKKDTFAFVSRFRYSQMTNSLGGMLWHNDLSKTFDGFVLDRLLDAHFGGLGFSIHLAVVSFHHSDTNAKTCK